ncbi:hypothetical protein HanPI659440_Chr06g0234851 [Helianthus annuus]|nr:hypothetical protein HanPI659440_Chr06g0234851 [Helianthus annuus]
MSSMAPERKTCSNTMEMEMTGTEDVMVEIPDNQLINNNNIDVIGEWVGCIRGKETTRDCKRQRHIQKVPPLLLQSEKGRRNHEYYKPAVVSLGPYHYKQTRLAKAEEYKLITLEEYRLSTGEIISSLYDKVSEVVHDARKCYIEGSTDAYNDEEFNLMMLRDGCLFCSLLNAYLAKTTS